MIPFVRSARSLLATMMLLFPRIMLAADLGGAGEIDLPGGTGSSSGVRSRIRDLMFEAISFVGLIAVVMIVIAGIWLVISGSDDTAREKAKKMVIFVAIGIVVILLASVFVRFIINIAT